MTKRKGKNKRSGSHQPRMKRTAKSQKKWDKEVGYSTREKFRDFYFREVMR